MSEESGKLMNNFSNFIYSPEFGGSTDIFSRTKLNEVKKLSESPNTIKVTGEISEEIKNAKILETALLDEIAKIRDKDKNKNNNGKTFRNRFPYGECDYDSDPQKLESITHTSALDMQYSSIEFSRLCRTLFPDTYAEIDEEMLIDVFGSMADYPFINPKSQGMLSIGNLYKLFKQFYMGYNHSSSINQNEFFKKFLNISSLKTGKKDDTYRFEGFTTKIDDIYEFNPVLWYNEDVNTGDFTRIPRDKPSSDSYGAFFEAPRLFNMHELSSSGAFKTSSGGPTYTPTTEVNLKLDGIYDTTNESKYMLSNDSKVFCLLFQNSTESGRESEILNNYKLSDLKDKNSTSLNSLRLLYNANFVATQYPSNAATDPKNIYPYYIVKKSQYFQNQNTTTEQTGGRKKNTKGGSVLNIFDTTTIPNLLAKRIGKPFNPALFVESLKKYQGEKQNFSDDYLQELLNKIHDETLLPLILDNAKKIYGNQRITFRELRYLFHWSSVYTTYKKLLAHFFRNIYACYSHFKTLIVPFYKNKSFDKQNQLIPFFFAMETNVDNLLSEIKKIISYLGKNLIVKNAKTNVKNLFAGFDVMNKDSANATKKLFPNIIEDNFFKNFSLMALVPDHFKSFIQLFCLKYVIILGGIPIILTKNLNYIKNLPVCFQFFLRYRIFTTKNLIEQLQFFDVEIQEQQSPTDIKDIMGSINTEIASIFKEAQQLPNLMDKYRKYIELIISFGMKKFISLLKELINNLSKTGSARNNNSEKQTIDSPENFKLIGKFKQEIYYFMQKLQEKSLPENLYLFLFGKLFNFIYRLDDIIRSKTEISVASIKDFGIDLEWTNYDIKQLAILTTRTLTSPELQKTVKTRWFGLKTVSNNAASRRLSEIFYNPAIFTSKFWEDIQSIYLNANGNKQLLVIAVEIRKLGNKAYLMDLFETAKSFESKPVIQDSIKTIEAVDSKGVVEREYYGSNQIIRLESFMRWKLDLQSGFRKWLNKTKRIGNYELSKGRSELFQKSEIGRATAEYFGIRRQQNDRGFHQTELMKRLLSNELDRYVIGKNNKNKDTKLKTSILMGYDRKQLNAILQKNVFELPNSRRIATDTTSYNDYQVYLIKSDELENIQKFRLWLWKLLMSKPWFFNQIYEQPGQIPLSDFSQIQVPFGRIFTKTGNFGLSSFLLEYYKEITKEVKESFVKNKNKNKSSFFSRFVPMTSITQLELPKVNVLPDLKIPNTTNGNKIKGINYVNSAGVSGSVGSAVSSMSKMQQQQLSQQQREQFLQSQRTTSALNLAGRRPSSGSLLSSPASFSLYGSNQTSSRQPNSAQSARPFGSSIESSLHHSQNLDRSVPFTRSSLGSSANLSRSVQSPTTCERALTTPLGRFLIEKYNPQGNTLGFTLINGQFIDGPPICEFSFYNNQNSKSLIFQISINADNTRNPPQYWCRLNDINDSIPLLTTDNNTFTCIEYKIVVNLQNGTIFSDKTNELKWSNGDWFYWRPTPPALAPSRTNNSRISPPGFNSWVNFVRDNGPVTKFLDKTARNEGDKRIVLEFYEGNTILIRIYITNGRYYLFCSKITGGAQNIEIKQDINSNNFYAQGSISGNTVIINFNIDLTKLLSYNHTGLQNLTFDPSTGYSFKP
jgi:hypothetical protein